MRRLFYLVREAWANMRTNRLTTIVAILTTAFTLTCVGIFLLIYVNLQHAAAWVAWAAWTSERAADELRARTPPRTFAAAFRLPPGNAGSSAPWTRVRLP